MRHCGAPLQLSSMFVLVNKKAEINFLLHNNKKPISALIYNFI